MEFDQHSNKTVGHVDFGTNIVRPEEKKFAKDALVYMVSGVSDKFKIPVAYFLVDGLKAVEKAALTKEVILLVGKTGIKIVGLTFDGLISNFAMAQEMGASIEEKPFIQNPHSDKIYLFPDACHMIKLIRNCFASKKKLYDGEENCIDWNFLVELERYQREKNINLGNKINKTHLQWDRKKMSVRLACETLSNSVADSLDILRLKGMNEFLGSAATAQYIRRINNVFDILNSMHESGTGFKRPICPETKNEYFKYFDESIAYIKGLKLSLNPIKHILGSRSRTGYVGFIVAMTNFRSLYIEYVDSNIIPHVMTFCFSQDHLELLFACIRQMVINFRKKI